MFSDYAGACRVRGIDTTLRVWLRGGLLRMTQTMRCSSDATVGARCVLDGPSCMERVAAPMTPAIARETSASMRVRGSTVALAAWKPVVDASANNRLSVPQAGHLAPALALPAAKMPGLSLCAHSPWLN